MSSVYPMTLLYDAACPVCALEMDHLRARNDAGHLLFIDIGASGFDPAPYGATLAEMNAEIHARCGDGRVIHGVEVLRLAYAAVGLGWVLGATAWPPLRPVSDAAYRLFARHRVTISRHAAPLIRGIRALRAQQQLRRMRACSSGACDLPSQAAGHPSPRHDNNGNNLDKG